jgi:glycosyltransferase involved in cell wall biosynthesis
VPKKTLCSVITPVYNGAQYIADAIRSVQSQTIGAENIEHIVIDDGSTDNTAEVVRRFGDAVRLIQVQNGGVSRARNIGIAAATSPYVAFLDSDDYWLPQFLERALERLARENRIFVVVDGYVEDNGKRRELPVYRARPFACLFDLDASVQLEFAVEDNFISIFSVVPRDAVQMAGGFNTNLRYGEDWDLWLRLLKLGYAARLVTEPCRVYRRHEGSTTSGHSAEMARDRIFVLSQYRDYVSPHRWKRAHAIARWLTIRAFLKRLLPAH